MQCTGWHSLDGLVSDWVIGGIDRHTLEQLVAALPGIEIGIGVDKNAAIKAAERKARSAAEKFCKLIPCPGSDKCDEHDFSYEIVSEGQGPVDYIVTIKVTRVECKCSFSD
jgi:hypothetical protein